MLWDIATPEDDVIMQVVTWAKSMEAILKTKEAAEALKLSQDGRDADQTLTLEASTSGTIR